MISVVLGKYALGRAALVYPLNGYIELTSCLTKLESFKSSKILFKGVIILLFCK